MGSGKPLEILAKLNELAGFLPDEEIELFEVNCSSFAASFLNSKQGCVIFQVLIRRK